ncbi:metallophosphoesterase family protein [Rhizobium sp. BK068]|uniref:metallophosphoesterase family protein n=1 Tax=Rhizobium sp. BK068 TaxID=2512130 RepID=UPI0010461B03|nr:metallophosphoesterase family protein [Rhizobium sp. BK068]TCM79217.1 putative phosphodiesterase [Rhizobium sp. BK068]
MRFAAIADIHGNHLALEAVLADIAAQGITDIVNLGDCFSGPLTAGRTAELLRAQDMPTVRGNHDRYLIEQPRDAMHASDAAAFDQLTVDDLQWLRSLPTREVYRDEVYLCHATPADDSTYWLESVSTEGDVFLKPLAEIEALAKGADLPLILCGHSHLPRVVRLSDNRLIVNPGSVGCPAYDDDVPRYHKVETGHPLASYCILEKGQAGWLPAFRTVAYDHMAMSRLAKENARLDWAGALATGWMP